MSTEPTGQDFIVTELLSELKAESARKSKIVLITIIAAVLSLLMVVAGFLLYLNQYDFSSTTTATGVYTVVDSEGNVIASDVTSEELTSMLEVITDGEGDQH